MNQFKFGVVEEAIIRMGGNLKNLRKIKIHTIDTLMNYFDFLKKYSFFHF